MTMLRVLLLVMVVMSAGYASDLKDLVKGVFEDLADFPSDVEDDADCAAGSFINAKSKCVLCAVGTFSDKVNSTECTPCAAGSYNDKRGQTVCTACTSGTFSDKERQKTCSPCSSGSYSDKDGATACTDCAPGSFAAATGATECSLCAAGSFAESTAAIKCELCAAGTISPDEGSATCTACTPGSFAAATGATECSTCAAGSFAETTAATKCELCSAGTISADEGSATCTDCPAGAFAADAGSTECAQCSPATFSDKTGQATCTDCSAGTYSPYKGSVTCAQCDAGTMSAAAATECTSCPAGSHASAKGSVSCDACEAGTIASKKGSADCTACPAGSSTEGGISATECTVCAIGSFAEGTGSALCTACPSNTTTTTYSTGSTSAAACIGPALVVMDIKGAPLATLYETGALNNSLGEIASLMAKSGDWKIRYVDDPNEVLVIPNGEVVELHDQVVYTAVPDMANIFCYFDLAEEGYGQYFKGKQQVDANGNKCQSACSNEEKDPAGPTCQIEQGGETILSSCGIPTCVWDVKCYSDDGTNYRGDQDHTADYTCQKWSSNWPHYHSKFHPSAENTAQFGIGDNSKCRNPDPDNAGQPWCYTTNLFTRVAFCSELQHCEESGLPIFSQ